MSGRQERDWRLYADDILQACAKVRHIVSGMTCEAFVADEIRVDATLRVSLRIVWDTATTHMVPLEDAVRRLIQ